MKNCIQIGICVINNIYSFVDLSTKREQHRVANTKLCMIALIAVFVFALNLWLLNFLCILLNHWHIAFVIIQGTQTVEFYIEVTSWLVSADDFSSRVARGANERVSAANE